MKKCMTTFLFIIVFLLGLGLLLYPTVSDYWNTLHQSKVISEYEAAADELDGTEYTEWLADAEKYNDDLRRGHALSADVYDRLLDVSGNGIMGYVEIPAIDVSLAVYHGTDESVLQIAAGHIERSSLPIGGEGTHSVLTAHRGLPSAKLFTNLDKLVNGDRFHVRVLDERLTYEVDQVEVVLPHQVDALQIEGGKDLCTLVTCTPYSVNSHRLLVRGHRIENEPDVRVIDISADAGRFHPLVISVPLIVLLFILIQIFRRARSSASVFGR